MGENGTSRQGQAWCSRERHAPWLCSVARTCVLSLVVGLLAATDAARAQSVDSTLWCLGPGDRVLATARVGNTIYLGGNFSSVGPATGGGVPIAVSTSAAVTAFPRVAGQVNAVVPDGQGGWYIGGLFNAVEGKSHSNLAHLTAAGVDEAWPASTNDRVCSLVMGDGVLYAGGDFDSVGAMPREHVAAIRLDDGAPTGWRPQLDRRVSALLLADSVLYVGGQFSQVGGLPRSFAAAIDTATALPRAWAPAVDAEVNALAKYDTTIFVGGYFSYVGDSLRPNLAAFSSHTAQLLPWNAFVTRKPDFSYDGGPRVQGLLVRDSTLFVAGSFKTIGGQPRQGLAALNIRTAVATTWDPRTYSAITFGAYFRALALSGDTLFAAGQADSIGGQASSYLAALRVGTAERIAWDPNPNWEVFTLAVAPGALYAGGGFTSIGSWVVRRHLASIDANTGKVLPWNPGANDFVEALIVDHGVVYVGGVFTAVGGQPRGGLAALDGVTGLATAWNPQLSGSVRTLALSRGALLVGGAISAVGGVPRGNAAAIDTATAVALPWNPQTGDVVTCMVPTDSVIYLGGWFKTVAGQNRAYLAAVDPISGAPTPWAPQPNAEVNALAVLNRTVYIAGIFNLVNGMQRDALAAIDPSGALTPWSANADQQVFALAASDSTVYAGGEFSEIAGQPRFCLAALDARTGAARDWYPAPDGIVWSLSCYANTVYIGGSFERVGVWPQTSLAAATSVDAQAPPGPSSQFSVQNFPNPTRGPVEIRYVLPSASIVDLVVYDIQGRRIASVLTRSPESAGPHSVALQADRWGAGCFFYRLESRHDSATRKLVVVK